MMEMERDIKKNIQDHKMSLMSARISKRINYQCKRFLRVSVLKKGAFQNEGKNKIETDSVKRFFLLLCLCLQICLHLGHHVEKNIVQAAGSRGLRQ